MERCHNHQECHRRGKHRTEAGTAGKRCPNRIKAIFQTLRHRPGSFRGAGCILCSVFGFVAFLANFSPLLPTGDGIGCDSICFIQSLPIPGFKICLIRFLFQLRSLFNLLELMAVSGIADFPDAALSRGYSLLKCLRTDILMDLFIKVLVCFIAGAGAGIGTGFAGMSAAAVIGPMLVTFLGIPAYQAVGIGLMSDVLASSVSAWTYKRNGNLDVKRSLLLLISVLTMTAVGSYVASFLPEQTMSGTMQVAMIFIGLRFLLKPVQTTKEQMAEQSKNSRIVKSIVGGVIVGFICGTVGAGGGMMLLFVLTSFLGYEMHMAVGTSVFIMAFTALTGGVSHFAVGGMPDIVCLVLCVMFTFLWARIAAVIANKSSAKTLNRVVGVVMIATSIVILVVNYLS